MKRMTIPILLLAVAVTFLTGCGGGGGSNSSITVQIQGPPGNLNALSQILLTATVTGTVGDTSVVWSIVEGSPAGGTLSNIQANQVTYTAPNVSSGVFHVKAISMQDSSKSATFTVTVVSNPDAITVTVNGPTSPIAPGDSVAITATVNGTSNQTVTWAIVEGSPAGGTLSNEAASSVTYNAPNIESTYHLRATSVENPAKSGTAAIVVSLEPPPPPGSVKK
ncbi:MAG: hypothetical protein ACYC0V_07580 [Armatimonadota bacterium]